MYAKSINMWYVKLINGQTVHRTGSPSDLRSTYEQNIRQMRNRNEVHIILGDVPRGYG